MGILKIIKQVYKGYWENKTMKTTLPVIARKHRGFTLIELLVVIAIIALLAAILFPVFARARENARRTSCQSNLKQIGLGIVQYYQDYDECLPASVTRVSTTGYFYCLNNINYLHGKSVNHFK